MQFLQTFSVAVKVFYDVSAPLPSFSYLYAFSLPPSIAYGPSVVPPLGTQSDPAKTLWAMGGFPHTTVSQPPGLRTGPQTPACGRGTAHIVWGSKSLTLNF